MKYESGASKGTSDATIAFRRPSPRCPHASTNSAGTRSTPTLLVSAARDPASPANQGRRARAHQNARRDITRKSDSLYGARKKKLAGKHATSSTVLRAMFSENSRVVSANSTTKAQKKATLDTRRPPLSSLRDVMEAI